MHLKDDIMTITTAFIIAVLSTVFHRDSPVKPVDTVLGLQERSQEFSRERSTLTDVPRDTSLRGLLVCNRRKRFTNPASARRQPQRY